MEKTQLRTAQLGETGLEITRIFRQPQQIDPILDAANLELSDEDVDEIEGRRGWGNERARRR
jgi:hypothetical protein